MRIAIVDDNPSESEKISSYINEYVPQNTPIAIFPSGECFLEQWRANNYDLVILDMFMDEMMGIDVAREIRKKDEEVCLVFYTTSNEFASESYEVNAKYYLRKPISKEQVRTMLDRLNLQSLEEKRSVLLPDGSRILLKRILYTECVGHNICFSLSDGSTTILRMTQDQTEKLLCAYPFFQTCMKGIIVNLNYVEDLTGEGFLLKNGRTLPISRRKAKAMKEVYTDFLFQQTRKEG